MKSVKKNMLQRFAEMMKRFYLKHKPVDRRDAIRLAVLVIAVPVFIYSSYQLIHKLYTYIYEDRQMQGVVDQKPGNGENPFENLDNTEGSDSGLPYQVINSKDSYLND